MIIPCKARNFQFLSPRFYCLSHVFLFGGEGTAGLLRFGMALFVDGFQLLIDHVGIHLSRGYVAVTHQLLQGAEVGAVFQQMHCEAMPQGVGRDILLNARLFLVALKDFPEALTAHPRAAYVDEQRLLSGVVHHEQPDFL